MIKEDKPVPLLIEEQEIHSGQQEKWAQFFKTYLKIMERERSSKEVAGDLGDLGENGNPEKHARHVDYFSPGNVY